MDQDFWDGHRHRPGGYLVPFDKSKLEGAPRHTEGGEPVDETDFGSRLNNYHGH